MARTLQQIKDELLAAKANEPQLDSLNSDSRVSIWGLFMFVVAKAIWTLEQFFDLHKLEVDEALEQLKPHTLRWYRNKALDFQYGFDLIDDSDNFDNSGATEQQIEDSKVVKYSAVTEAENESRLIIKIAGEENGELAPLPSDVIGGNDVAGSFKHYISEVKDAGVNITVINYLPDRLRLIIRIKRDPLVLNNLGMDIDTGIIPVNVAIKEFMRELPFNGELSIQDLTDKIQDVQGVLDLSIDLAETAWIDAETDSYGDWETIDMSRIPVSGYFKVNLDNETEPTYSTISYV